MPLGEEDALLVPTALLEEDGLLLGLVEAVAVTDPELVGVTLSLGVGEPVDEGVPVLEGEEKLVDDTVALPVPVGPTALLEEDGLLLGLVDAVAVTDPELVGVTLSLGVAEPVDEGVPVLEGEEELVDDTVALPVAVGDTL